MWSKPEVKHIRKTKPSLFTAAMGLCMENIDGSWYRRICTLCLTNYKRLCKGCPHVARGLDICTRYRFLCCSHTASSTSTTCLQLKPDFVPSCQTPAHLNYSQLCHLSNGLQQPNLPKHEVPGHKGNSSYFITLQHVSACPLFPRLASHSTSADVRLALFSTVV